MSTTSADSRFVFANGWRLAAFGGGLGLVPKAPGTAGSAAAALFFALLQRGFGMQDAAAAAIAVLLVAVGFVICEKAEPRFGRQRRPRNYMGRDSGDVRVVGGVVVVFRFSIVLERLDASVCFIPYF